MENVQSPSQSNQTSNPQNLPKSDIEPSAASQIQGLGSSKNLDTVPVGTDSKLSGISLASVEPTSGINVRAQNEASGFPFLAVMLLVIILAIGAYKYARYKVWI